MMKNHPDFDDHDKRNRQMMVQQEKAHLPSTEFYETMPDVDEEEIHLRDYIDVILRRRWVVIIVLLVVFSSVAVFTFTSTPLYLAQGTLKAASKGMKVTNFQAMDDSYMKSQEFIATQVELLKSDRLLSRLITKLDLNNNKYFADRKQEESRQGVFASVTEAMASFKGMIKDIIRPEAESSGATNRRLSERISLERNLGKIKNGLKITPIRNTELIQISFENKNPQLASDMVNTLMKEFLQITMEGQLTSFRSADVYLTKQITEAKIKLEKSEKELNQYARRTGIVSLDSKLNLVMRQLEEVNGALVQAVTNRINRESLYRQTQKDGAENLPAVVNNEIIQNLKKQYSDLLSQYQVLSTVFKDDYPEIKKIRAQMDDLQNRYTLELKRAMDSIRLEYEAALDKEERLKKKAEEQKKLTIDLNDRATQYKILRREVVSNKEVYNSLLSRSKEIEASVGSAKDNIEIIDLARPPLGPYKPKVMLQLLLGILVGLFGGVGLAFLLEYMDNTVKDPEEFAQRYRIPVLGLLPFVEKESEDIREIALKFYNDPKAPLSEAVRTAMFSVELSSAETPPKTILITSVLPNAGKTTISSNLSLSLLPGGSKVLLIDADLRKPGLHKVFREEDNNNHIGLSSFLAGTTKLEEVIQKTEFDNLFFIPSGPIPPSPAELLASSRMRKFIAAASEKFDYVIIDAPPFHGFAEILILSNMVDGVILVAELNTTPRDGVEYFRKAVTNVGGRISGVLVNKVPKRGAGYRYYSGYKYSGYYSYDYQYGRDE